MEGGGTSGEVSAILVVVGVWLLAVLYLLTRCPPVELCLRFGCDSLPPGGPPGAHRRC